MSEKKKFNRTSTSTSAFGTSGRVGHDSSKFYASKLYDGLRQETNGSQVENPIPESSLNKIFLKSSERMDELPDGSVHLMITSPPYNVTKEYDDNLTLDEYRGLLKRVFAETFRVLVDGGRACINVANLGRKPYIPLHALIIQDMQAIGYQMRGEIIWDKASSASPSTAWGSWQSASNPTLRDIHEYILIFTKGNFTRKKGEKENTISKEEFLEFTKSVWQFPAERAKRVGHPAPFPIELPRRLIQLYTFAEDVVLDPFCGSGSTCIAATLSGRSYVGYELKKEYVDLIEKRIRDEVTNPKSQIPMFEGVGNQPSNPEPEPESPTPNLEP
ncbi:MAG: site-specific DNA-methyltransferase [Ignavibacteriae bacterium]|nr:site-specific DNA-methyltransferase [Ignavibacteriota bacterium]